MSPLAARLAGTSEAPPLELEDDSFDLTLGHARCSRHDLGLLVGLAGGAQPHVSEPAASCSRADRRAATRPATWAKVPRDATPARTGAGTTRQHRVGTERAQLRALVGTEGGAEPSSRLPSWWIREHCGAGSFDVISVEERGVMLEAAVERPGRRRPRQARGRHHSGRARAHRPGDPREIEALKHNIRQLHHESLAASRGDRLASVPARRCGGRLGRGKPRHYYGAATAPRASRRARRAPSRRRSASSRRRRRDRASGGR